MIFFKYFSHKRYILTLLLFINLSVFAQEKAVWATAWDINTPEKIDNLLSTIHKYGFKKLFVATRYRSDALYFPNRKDSTYNNPDSICYLLKDSIFDPLQYTIEKAGTFGIKVYAWVTTFVATPHDLRKITAGHIYYTHPDWFLQTKEGKVSPYNEYEGAFLDPALPEVRQYLINVFSDIVTNYDIAGIQLDYVRYPDSVYGWNGFSRMLADSVPGFDFDRWKQQKISSFVNYAYITLKNLKPGIEVSAAVISDTAKARMAYSQIWTDWLEQGYIDRVYVMAYNTSNCSFADLIRRLNKMNQHGKMTIVIRSWRENKPYHVSKINDKLSILKKYHFNSVGFYNYAGLIQNNYLPFIRF
jgi:uncharacterized lipoprotein YddW (UPF0748 family)